MQEVVEAVRVRVSSVLPFCFREFPVGHGLQTSWVSREGKKSDHADQKGRLNDTLVKHFTNAPITTTSIADESKRPAAAWPGWAGSCGQCLSGSPHPGVSIWEFHVSSLFSWEDHDNGG